MNKMWINQTMPQAMNTMQIMATPPQAQSTETEQPCKVDTNCPVGMKCVSGKCRPPVITPIAQIQWNPFRKSAKV